MSIERTMFSGPRIIGFRGGWALKLGNFKCAHYFKRDEAGYCLAICGAGISNAGVLHERGDFPQCKRCLKMRQRTTPPIKGNG